MSLQHIQKNSPRLLPKPAKFEKNPPNGYRVIRKTKCGAGGAGGAGGARSSPIHKQASLAGRLISLRHTQLSHKFIKITPRKKNFQRIFIPELARYFSKNQSVTACGCETAKRDLHPDISGQLMHLVYKGM